jgi:hypothetical protein
MMTKRRVSPDYAPDNVNELGEYIVGKNRPPENGKFRAGDGRPRGQRKTGTRNLATDLREVLETKMAVSVGAKKAKVSRQLAMLMRLSDNACRGSNPAIALTMEYQQRIVEPVLAKELKKAEEISKPDYSKLTLVEMRALEYLLCKAEDRPYNGTPPTIVDDRPRFRPMLKKPAASEPEDPKGQ